MILFLIIILTSLYYICFLLDNNFKKLEKENIKLKTENNSYKRALMSFDPSFAEYVKGKENER